MTSTTEPKILAIADSDSYLKWVAGLLDMLPRSWHSSVLVVRTPIAPSASQITAATAGTRFAHGTTPILTARRIRRLVEANGYDIVLLGATGPVVDVLLNRTLAGIEPRPAFVSGLPGISIPATERAVLFRSSVDLFITHSRREANEFKQLAATMGASMEVGLATLPSLRLSDLGDYTPKDRVVFAPQALVPFSRQERERILLALADLAHRRPDLTPVVKLRATNGEAQTHREQLSYEELWRDLARARRVRQSAVGFVSGPMHEHLGRAAGFVTVSSTAALEAIVHDVPSIVLTDFGVSEEMINVVFEGSQLLGTLDDLTAGRFFSPNQAWLRDNYFHPDANSDLLPRLADLSDVARVGSLPLRQALMNNPEYTSMRRRAARRLHLHPWALRLRYAGVRYLRFVHSQPRFETRSPRIGEQPKPR